MILVWLRSPSRDLRVGGGGGANGWILGLGLPWKLSPFLSYGRHLSLIVLTLEGNLRYLI